MQVFQIPKMRCEGCINSIKTALKSQDESLQLETDLASRTIRVETRMTAEALIATLTAAGYPPA